MCDLFVALFLLVCFFPKITPKENLLFVELRIAKTDDAEVGPVVERSQVSSSKS